MKSILKQSLKLFALSLTVAVIFTLSQSVAQAQLTVTGSTLGSTFTPGETNVLGGLSFLGTPFGGTTSPLVLDLNNMGKLTITPSDIGGSFGTFTLRVAFREPDGVVNNPVEVVGEVFGTYTDEFNFALVNFAADAPTPVSFVGANGAGLFSLAVDDVCLFQGNPCETSDFPPPPPIPILTKFRRHRLLNALAFNTAKSGGGNVKFVKAKGSSSTFAPVQEEVEFTITATITILQFGPTNKDQCKDDGWRTFFNPSFRNQGECVSAIVPE